MANKKISELQSRTPALSDLMLVGDPSSGYSYKCTVTALATIIETDIADGYVTIGTTQTISGAKTFSNNLTLTSVVNTPTDPDKFLTLNASNVVTYRTGGEVLSDIGGVGGSGTTNYLPKFSATTTLANSQIFDNGTNIGIATATPDATARVQINKTDGYGLYLNYNTSAGSGITTTALYAINTTASSGYAAVIEEKTPNTTAGQYPFVIKHSLSSGTAGVGFGTGVHFQLLDDAGTSKTTQLTIENIDAAAATYKTRYRFNVQNNGSSTPVVYINGTGLGVFTASPSVALDVTGEGKFSTINNATTDTDKFLVSDSGVLKYRTGAEVLSDIGGQGALTLTTSGSSGAATLVGNTLNIPNYGSALSGYVPYTGATTNVNLGTRYLQANYLVVDGQSNATGINFKQYSSVSFNGDGYTAMGPVSVDKMFFNFAQGSNIFKIFYFDVSGITGNATRAYTMPNSDGTLALTSQIPTVSGTTNYIPKFTSSSAIGNSIVVDNSNHIEVGGYALFTRSGKTTIINPNVGSGNTTADFGVGSGMALTFTTDVEKMRLTSGGLLGIGTSAPGATLDVNGNSFIRTGQKIAGYFNTNAGDGYILNIGVASNIGYLQSLNGSTPNTLSLDGNDIRFRIGSFSEAMRLDASGNLGINTSSPTTKLTIKDDNNNIGTNSTILLTSNNGFATTSYGWDNLNTNYDYSFKVSGSTKMLLDNNGNLGLGTSSPSYKLDVNGAARINNLLWFTPSSGLMALGANGTNFEIYNGAGAETRLTLTNSGNLGLGVSPAAWSGGQALQILNGSLYGSGNLIGYAANSYLANSAANDRYIVTGAAIKYLGNINGDHRWYVAPSGTAGDIISFTQAMTLDASGRLLVGQTSAYTTAKVQVGGANSITSANSIFAVQKANEGYGMYFGVIGSGTSWIQSSDANEGFRYSLALQPNGGNVGIGTTSPDTKLQVAGTGATGFSVRSNTSGDAFTRYYLDGTIYSDYYVDRTTGNVNIRANTDAAMIFSTGAALSERMRITSGGNVGIGTTSPAGQFEVYTDVYRRLYTSNIDAYTIRLVLGANSYIQQDAGNEELRISQQYGSGKITFYTGATNTERMRITSGGELLINTTSDAGDYKLQVNGNAIFGSSTYKLHTYSDAGGAGLRTTGGTGTHPDIYMYNAGTNGLIQCHINNTARLQITNTGIEVDGSIKTAAPSGGTAAAWKLGERVASSSLTLNTTQYIQLDINGTLYTLATVNLS